MHARAIKWLGGLLIILLLMGSPAAVAATRLEINGDKVSIEARRIPMRVLLKQFSRQYGIAVKIDPEIDPIISMSFNNREIEDGLKAILKPHNFILVWKREKTSGNESSGPSYKLEEIHIFKPGHRDRMVDIQEPNAAEAPDGQPDTGEEAETDSDSELQTRVIIKDNKVFVPVTIGYGNNEIETNLVFDTGAGSVVLHSNVARQLGIDQGRESKGEGVGGIKIATTTTRLDFVQLGPYKKEDLRADIIDYDGDADSEYNGLLGMNFIRGLKYVIDFDNQVIKWLR